MSDTPNDTTPPPETVCQHTMRGSKTVRRGFSYASINRWSAACPNRATGTDRRGRWVCGAHGGPKR